MGKNAKKKGLQDKNQLAKPDTKLLKKKIKRFNSKSKPPAITNDDDTDTETRKQKTEVFLEEIHKVFQELNSKNPNAKNRVKEYILEKLCEKCMDPTHDHLLLLCDVCDDAYHTFCLDPPLKTLPSEDEEWLCPPCIELKKKSEQSTTHEARQSTLDEHFSISTSENIRMCGGCDKKIEEIALPVSRGKPSKQKSKEICIKCQKFYHPACFNTRSTSILCGKCETFVKTNVPRTDKTLFDFYTVKPYKVVNRFQSLNSKISTDKESQASTDDVEYIALRRLSTPFISPKKAKLQKVSRKMKVKKKTTLFKLPKLSEDPKILFTQKTLLAGALISKNITFDDDLCFSNPKCPPQSNNSALEPNLQKMDPDNLAIFKRFKEMSRNGNYAPMYVIEDKIQGFIVQAAEDIPIYTLISEYVGEVDFARNRLFDKNDSIMDLLRTTRSSTSLVICPESRGNIARFFSGINNSDSSSRQKQNVRSIRYNIEGHARVLLYAGKNIKAGEILYYDYNAGGFNGYPTEEFV